MRLEAIAETYHPLDAGETIIAELMSDLTIDGYYSASSTAVLTNRRLIITDPAHPEGTLLYPLQTIEYIDLIPYYGNSVLSVKVIGEERPRRVLRLSRSLDGVAGEWLDRADDILRDLGVFDDRDAIGRPTEKAKSEQSAGRCRSCGRALPLERDICNGCIDKRGLLKRTFTYLRRYPVAAAATFVLSLTTTMLQLIPTYLTKIMLDDVLIPGRLDLLWWVIGAIVSTHAFLSILNGVQIYAIHWLGNKIIVDLRTEVYAKLQQLTMAFYDKRQTGWIMSRVTNDTSFLQNFMVNGVQQIIVHLLMIIGITVVLFVLNWRLALITLLPLPIVTVGTMWFSRKMHKVYHRIWRRVSNMHAMLGDTIPGIRVVKAFTREQDEVDRFAEKNRDVFTENMKAITVSAYFFPSMGFLMAIGTILLWAFGGYEAIVYGTIQPGELMAFIGYTWMLYNPIQALSRISEQVQGAITAAERLFEVMDTEPETDENEDTDLVSLSNLQGAIEFKDVSFYYEKGDPVLHEINIKIKPGEMIGLVGSSGSGKTTMINLITRFYKVTSGHLFIDGIDIDRINLNDLRSQIGLVLQDPFLFHGTIAENISYGRPDASIDDIVHAATLANAHHFIMNLPDGYDTRIGERGVGLSGGEKQRISIARAILKDPRILIFDEATSAVDTETEKLIQEAIDHLTTGRTTIAIAHRLSTLQNADVLLVLKDGRIVETGTHEELLARPDGLFKHFVDLQKDVGKGVRHGVR